MSHSAIERTLQQFQINQLFDDPLHGPGCDAILILNGLIGLVECSSIDSKRFDFCIERFFRDGQALVQPNLSGNPYAFKLAIGHLLDLTFQGECPGQHIDES